MGTNFEMFKSITYKAMRLKELVVFYVPSNTYHSMSWTMYHRLTGKDSDIRNDLQLLASYPDPLTLEVSMPGS